MSDDQLGALLAQLNRGDLSAAEAIYVEFEPYLRMVVRRQITPRLRTRFDSVDIVQSVWVDLIDGFREAAWSFADLGHLRAFLVKTARNRFIDRLRQNRTSLDREHALGADGIEDLPSRGDPHPSELIQADELWQQITEDCSPRHLEVLQYKRQGLPLADIAARTGLHESSVRRILYELARRLAAREQTLQEDA